MRDTGNLRPYCHLQEKWIIKKKIEGQPPRDYNPSHLLSGLSLCYISFAWMKIFLQSTAPNECIVTVRSAGKPHRAQDGSKKQTGSESFLLHPKKTIFYLLKWIALSVPPSNILPPNSFQVIRPNNSRLESSSTKLQYNRQMFKEHNNNIVLMDFFVSIILLIF